MFSRLSVTIVVTSILAFTLVVLSAVSDGAARRTPETLAGVVPVIELDMDISDGACVDIDANSAAGVGTKQIGVCLTSNPNGIEVAGFEYKLLYNDTIIQAPEVADVAPSLDDNPDANAGTTTFTSGTYLNSLGGGWNCDGGVGAFPKGDIDGLPGDGDGTAFSGGCGSAAGPNTLLAGPLGVVTFNVLSTDSVNVVLSAVSVVDNDLVEIGSCDPVFDVPATCNGGTLNGGVEPTATNTTVPTATNTLVPTATNTTVPTSTNTTVPTATNTTVPTSTNTTVPTATNTTEPTATNTTGPTATNTTVPTATNTSVPTATNTTVPTATNTTVPTATNTAVPTATNTTGPSPTNTTVPEATNTPTPTNTPTSTSTFTPTSSPTSVPTATNTSVATATNTTVPTATNTTVPPTATNTTAPPTATNTPVPTATTPGGCPEDVNGDGAVTGRDVAMVARGLHGPLDPALDVDDDGDVDLDDLIEVVKAMHRDDC